MKYITQPRRKGSQVVTSIQKSGVTTSVVTDVAQGGLFIDPINTDPKVLQAQAKKEASNKSSN